MQVRNYMTGAAAVTHPDEPVVAAARLMRMRGIGALPVCEDDGTLAGMLTDRDIVVRCVSSGDDPGAVTVGSIMSRDPVTVEAGADIRRAMEQVRAANFPHVNMDLIAGLPEDTPEGFARSLDEVISMGADNITVHTLSLKKGSRITLEGSPLPSPAEVSEMLDLAYDRLTAQGYAPYYLYRQKFMSGGFENVGWTRPGQENLYNICIMEELCSILAMGGGASTKLVCPGGRLERHIDPKYPTEYIANIDRICAAKAKLEAFFL